MERNKKSVEYVSCSYETLQSLIDQAKPIIETHPYLTLDDFSFDYSYDSYGDSERICTMSYWRWETDEELEARVLQFKQMSERQEKHDREVFERLRERFGK